MFNLLPFALVRSTPSLLCGLPLPRISFNSKEQSKLSKIVGLNSRDNIRPLLVKPELLTSNKPSNPYYSYVKEPLDDTSVSQNQEKSTKNLKIPKICCKSL